MRPGDLAAYVENFRRRVTQDALAEATSTYWLRRARDFDAVGTAAGDEIARACRNRAAVALITGEPDNADLIACCLQEAT